MRLPDAFFGIGAWPCAKGTKSQNPQKLSGAGRKIASGSQARE